MAREVLTIAGTVVGAWFGNPQLGFAIGSIIGGAVDPQEIKIPGLRELPVMGVTEGNYRQVAYGTTVIRECQLIDWGDLDPVKVRERQGKGGPVTVSERLYQTYAVGLGEPIEAYRYIKRNGVMVYDVRPGSTILAESANFADRVRFYYGSETQLPDPDLEALPRNGVGNTPAYRGTAYFVVVRDDLTDLRGQIPTYEVEVTTAAGVATFTGLVTEGVFYQGPGDALEVGEENVFDGLSPIGGSMSSGPLGQYISFGVTGSPYLEIFKQNQLTGEYSRLLTGIPAIGSAASFTAFHPSGNYLALILNASEELLILARAGDVFTVVQTESLGSIHNGIAWSQDGTKLAVANTNFSSTVSLFQFVSGVLGTPLTANCTSNLFGGASMAFSQDSLHLAVGGNQGLDVFDCSSSSSFFHLDGLFTDNSGSSGVGFSPNGGYIYLCGTPVIGSNWLSVYSFNAAAIPSTDALEFDNFPAVQPSGVQDMEVTYDGAFVAVADGSDAPLIYESSGSGQFLTPVANQPPTTAYATNLVRWTNAPAIGVVTGGTVTLASIVADICDRCGIPAVKLDLSELTDPVRGTTLGGAYSGSGAIVSMMPAFLFDMYEADRKAFAPKRGAAVKAVLTIDDLLEEPDEATLRGQGTEYPRSLQLKYLNPAQDYAAPAVTVINRTTSNRVRGEVNVDLPIAFDETEALNAATRMLKVSWEDVNGEVVFSLPSGPFAWLTPTDCLGLFLRGALYRVRAEKAGQASGRLKVTGRRDRQSAYTSNLTAIPLPPPQPPPPSLAGLTTFVPMNIPGRVDSDDRLGFVFGMTGIPGSAWQGANIGYRVSGATNWIDLGNFTTRAVMGSLLAPLAAASEFYLDTTNVLEVGLVGDDELETITEAEFLSEGNPAAIVYPDGTAELLQFRDVVDEGSRAWTLTRLQRGRLATVPGPHLLGARFVMLDGTVFVPLPSSLIGADLQFRVTSIGTSPETAPVYDFTWNPVHSQLEFAPDYLELGRDAGIITATWAPRHRFGTDNAPVASVNFDGYIVTATDGVTTTSTPSVYSEISISDVFTGPVTVSVQQLNRFTGPGPATSEVIA